MKVEKRIHIIWKEWYENIKDNPKFKNTNLLKTSLVGKYQYIYTTKKGQISLVRLMNYFRDGKNIWEIYSLKGKLLEDVERFNTRKNAEKRIKELLE